VAISDQFDPNGTSSPAEFRATITATRINVERIPDTPYTERGGARDAARALSASYCGHSGIND
jgi:hypothetical protein